MQDSKVRNLIAGAPFLLVKKIFLKVPFLRKAYLRHSASYKFWICKLKLKFHILRPTTFVQWLATYECNFKCQHCEATAGKKKPSELKTDQVLKLVDELSEMKVKNIFISGGEPLMREDLFQIIEHIFNKGMRYGIASNSYLVDSFKEQFNKMKPYLFFTSIDGIEQSSDKLRRMPGAFNKCLEALNFF